MAGELPKDNPPPLRVAVLASGSGTNLQAILDRAASGELGAEVVLVVCNNRDAMALERARKAGVTAVHWSETMAGSPERFGEELLGMFRGARVDLVVLAGYMKLVPRMVVEAYQGRMLNIHPALLPQYGGKGFYGMRVHEAVIASGETESGATVHFVDPEYDRGPIYLQRRVPVLPGDTPEMLRDRVLELEHELLPEAVAKFARERRAAGTKDSGSRLSPG